MARYSAAIVPVPDVNLALRKASRCWSPRCSVSAAFTEAHVRDDEGATTWSGPVLHIVHNGEDVLLAIGSLEDMSYDVWQILREQWASKASDLHREEAMQSDWPVF